MKDKQNYCIQGHVTKTQVICDKKPFSLSYDGRILYNEEVFLTKTRTNIFGVVCEKPWDRDIGNTFVEALNNTYKAGYEQDRFEYK